MNTMGITMARHIPIMPKAMPTAKASSGVVPTIGNRLVRLGGAVPAQCSRVLMPSERM